MSTSCVSRAEPCNVAATPPTTTNCTSVTSRDSISARKSVTARRVAARRAQLSSAHRQTCSALGAAGGVPPASDEDSRVAACDLCLPCSARSAARSACAVARLPLGNSRLSSRAQVIAAHEFVLLERLHAALEHDLAVHDDVAAVGDADRLVEVLLGH